jgi:pimeloyl-ACP methyl ester carboxylesterase
MLLFQFEDIAETWLTADNWANFRSWGRHPHTDEIIAQLRDDGSLTPALNWYRANLHPRSLVGSPPALPPVSVPTMGVWGTADFALLEQQMLDSAAYVSGPWTYRRVEGAGHWIQLDAPDQVNRLLLDFFAS